MIVDTRKTPVLYQESASDTPCSKLSSATVCAMCEQLGFKLQKAALVDRETVQRYREQHWTSITRHQERDGSSGKIILRAPDRSACDLVLCVLQHPTATVAEWMYRDSTRTHRRARVQIDGGAVCLGES
jgi:hypothetical protein